MMTVLQGELCVNEPLAGYTSWHVGGLARQLYKSVNLPDLANFLATLAPTEPMIWLGLGSNVLIRDGGIDGTVVYTQGCLKALAMEDKHVIRAEAGVTCAKLAKFCISEQFSAGAFFAGIPGTVGGALAMNAGAFGGETWRHVIAVETIDRQGVIRKRMPTDFQVTYREVQRPQDEWFVAGYFSFPSGDEAGGRQAIKELLQKRNATQPIGEFNCGSVFRNPLGDHAGRLIESCGLKGKKIGGAWVSTKHANFIINGGEAASADIESLIEAVQDEVQRKTGVLLKPECHFIGNH
jgi:UDP-N-acetylmuramate dehydrogenase